MVAFEFTSTEVERPDWGVSIPQSALRKKILVPARMVARHTPLSLRRSR